MNTKHVFVVLTSTWKILHLSKGRDSANRTIHLHSCHYIIMFSLIWIIAGKYQLSMIRSRKILSSMSNTANVPVFSSGTYSDEDRHTSGVIIPSIVGLLICIKDAPDCGTATLNEARWLWMCWNNKQSSSSLKVIPSHDCAGVHKTDSNVFDCPCLTYRRSLPGIIERSRRRTA